MNSITVLSANCRGLQNMKKRVDVLTYLKELNYNIVCLQDTHWTKKDMASVSNIWGGKCYIHGTRTNSRGVAILFKDNFEYHIISSATDLDGNYLCLTIKTASSVFNLLTLYGPNTDNPTFFRDVKDIVQQNNPDYYIMCGDFNLTLDRDLDSMNYKQLNNPKARIEVLNMIQELNLCDIFRNFYPKLHRYTWRIRNPVKQARLDYFLTSSSMIDLIYKSEIKPGYLSDHSFITLEIIENKFTIGKGVWKFNNDLLKDENYVHHINNLIDGEILNYALPIYHPNYIIGNYQDIIFTIDDDLFLEMVFLKIRGETIKFSSYKKKNERRLEKQLLEDIEQIENMEVLNFQLLADKKLALESLREKRIQGQMIRSRIQCLNESEKPSKFFFNLENKNFLDKTIKKVKTTNGHYLTEQGEILKYIENFYKDLFSNKDNDLENVDLNELLKDCQVEKVNDHTLGKAISTLELSEVLKKMKHNKSPGMDGITCEFLKVFWGKLKFFITRALNTCFRKGKLSTTLRQGIVTCIPKGTNERYLLKNWRPISLLCVTYKLASGVHASRLKTVLDKLISKTQRGFVSGRQISDCTRLVYDIMDAAENKNLPGLLLLIDFQKAFDSLSWKFLYNTLAFFGFDKQFIDWIKLFNNDIIMHVLQSGYLSEGFRVGRGCRQGDPISPYLFLFGGRHFSTTYFN